MMRIQTEKDSFRFEVPRATEIKNDKIFIAQWDLDFILQAELGYKKANWKEY